MEENAFDADAKNDFADKALRLQKALAALRAVRREKTPSSESLSMLEGVPAFAEFFELPLNSPEELEMKKCFASALIIAKEENALPFDIPESPEQIAVLVDEGLSTAKVAHRVGAGKMTEEDGFEELYDKTVSKVVAVAEKAIKDGLPEICDAVKDYFPAAGSVTDWIKENLPSEIVAEKVGVGIRKITDVAKPYVKKAVDFLSGTANKFAGGLKKFRDFLTE